MAVVGVLEDKGSGLRKRKRGRMRMKKKLDVNDKVEVRTGEQGFQGSWHQGTIISWDNQGCHVKYDNLLVDDGSDNLVEIVDASPLADGIDCRCGSQCNYRGSLRPLPPKLEFNQWNLCYGLCVDVYYTEAWWEGVIYDHEDGSEKRRVFFPDLGDEMLAEIRNLRITQDWNDFEEEWHQRGTWLFLEVIEEYEKEWYIPVSVKQLWYDLREKKGFQKNVKEWTSSCAALWKELVLEVIKDNQEITVDHFLRVSGLPGSSQPAIPVADVNMSHDTDLANTNTFGLEPAVPVADVDTSSDAGLADTLPLVIVDDPINNTMKSSNSASIQLYQDKYDTGQLGHILNDDNNFLTEFNGSSPDKAVCVVPEALLVSPSVADRISCISSVTSTEGSPGTDSDMAKTRARSSKLNATATWMTAGKDIVPKAEACPDAITKYALTGKKNNNALIIDARKHLLYQGWKIECKRDNIFRVRYISPGGDCYYSLYKLCLEFMEPSEKLISSNTTDLQVVEANNQDVHLVDLNTKDAHVVKPKTRDLHVVEPKTQELQVVEPEYCPQAVLDWSKADQKTYSCPSTRKDMILKAKKHLSWLGWTFRFANCNGRRYLCYVSPRGRAHGSLRKACQGCLKEEITETDNSPSGHVENMNVVKEDDSLLLSEELSSAHSNMAVQRTSVPSNAKSENWSGGCYTLGMRDLVELSSVGQETRKHKRKRKDSSLCLASLLGKRRANLPVENTSISACGKTPAALIKLREDLKGRQLNCVLRSTKRVQQVVTPSPLHKNPRTVLSWLIDNNVVLPRSKVHYGRKEQKSKFEGRITRDGIKCSCCEKVYTLGGFVVHAGGTNHKSAGNIFLEDGRSLLDCQLEMLHNNKMTKLEKNRKCRLKGNGRKDKNDCICSVCHYGGELILCDHCPSSFHKSCLGIKTVPDGDWFCPSCCCGICGQSEAKEDGANVYERSLISCAQCEHKYHAMCICSRGTYRWDLCAKANWFCSKKCEEIFLGLHELLGRPIPVGTDNLTWTLIKSMKSDTHDLDASDNEAVIENYSKLSIALDVMHECFEPVKETRTGRDLVADIIFSRSSELNRLNFQGFYTILLERNDELITAANVRVHGEKVAEVPLIGTRFQYRRLGMCRILMNELEKKLKEFGVQRLILPAVPSVLRTWTTSFGFSKMMPLERLNFVKYTFLDFQGAIMCQKLLLEGPLVEPKLLIGSQVELHNDAFHSSDKVDVDGASAVSEVFQAGQIEENGFMDQGLLEIDAGGQIDSNKTSVPIVDALQENQPTQVDHEPHDSGANSKCSVEDTNRKEKECGANLFLKFYTRRRKMSANGG